MKRLLTHEELDALGIPRGDDEGTYTLDLRRGLAEADAERAALKRCSVSQNAPINN